MAGAPSRAYGSANSRSRPRRRSSPGHAGDYVCPELGGLVYTFYVDGDALKMRARPAQRETLTPVFRDAFLMDGNTVRFTRDAAGRVEGLRISAGRVRNLRFAKR